MKPGDEEVRRVGYGLVVVSAFVAALCIYAIWTNMTGRAPPPSGGKTHTRTDGRPQFKKARGKKVF